MDIADLVNVDVETLREALRVAEGREKRNAELEKTRPRCACGKPATKAAFREIRFRIYNIKDRGYSSYYDKLTLEATSVDCGEEAPNSAFSAHLPPCPVFVTCGSEDCEFDDWKMVSEKSFFQAVSW